MAKRSKQIVRYQDHPLGSKRCGRCKHFEPPDACSGVAGKISPSGYCIRFATMKAGRRWYGGTQEKQTDG